mmetsp:Transcript_59548/g.153348  ORF Transcript_59548/g.153348 Transcript_59548/m.153348 type:complete len:252 (+) Transcript_59548:588-1343(+)
MQPACPGLLSTRPYSQTPFPDMLRCPWGTHGIGHSVEFIRWSASWNASRRDLVVSPGKSFGLERMSMAMARIRRSWQGSPFSAVWHLQGRGQISGKRACTLPWNSSNVEDLLRLGKCCGCRRMPSSMAHVTWAWQSSPSLAARQTPSGSTPSRSATPRRLEVSTEDQVPPPTSSSPLPTTAVATSAATMTEPMKTPTMTLQLTFRLNPSDFCAAASGVFNAASGVFVPLSISALERLLARTRRDISRRSFR